MADNKSVCIGRHINGITINPLEFILDDDGNERVFDNEETAKAWLVEMGFSDEEIYWLKFIPYDEMREETDNAE